VQQGPLAQLVQQAHKEQRELLESPALMEPQEPRALPAYLAQLEFKGQPERPACPVPLELQVQEQLVLPERQALV
jgi:hypothetical protein